MVKPKKVYVAMSGGVDSSVAAVLMKKQGFEVIGVFMKPWQPNSSFCLWQKDREDAMRAAAVIGIPLLTWDFSKEYKKSVTDYMIREYRAGRTPNPDVMCNKEIKFGLFLKKALKEGADFIVTGHYVRLKHIEQGTGNKEHAHCSLFTARDKNKDQSYFLWTLTQKQLRYCLFPIGDYTKPEVRKLAKNFNLPNHAKKDSQGVCFIGPLDMKEFLVSYIKPKPGKIIFSRSNLDLQGSTLKKHEKIIGQHDGVYYYTIGQRHGLNIGNGGGPYYVVAKDIKKNIIYVGTNAQARANETQVEGLSWIDKPKLPTLFDVKVRYRTKSSKARLDIRGTLVFAKPERAVTSGQSAVFYKGQQLLGGGIIAG